MTIEETVKNTPLSERPLINDTPGQPAHPMTDEQYADYLRMQAEMEQLPPPAPSPEERLDRLEAERADMIAAYEEGVNNV